MLVSVLIAAAVLAVLTFVGSRGWRGALLGIALSLLLAAAVIGGAILLTPRGMSPEGRRYIIGQHVVGAADVTVVCLASVGLGAGATLLRRRLASRKAS